MKAMILAAGLGTRLKPWTLEHPKALVPVHGKPMLKRVIDSLEHFGFYDLTLNIHHFGEQIVDFIKINYSDRDIKISDERDNLLDTGGGILNASELLFKKDKEPFLVHNVDILSNADLKLLMEQHCFSQADITLLTSQRESSRKLLFDKEGNLRGWHNLSSDEYKPSESRNLKDVTERAFSGIYVMGERSVKKLFEYSEYIGNSGFPIMDFFLDSIGKLNIKEFYCSDLKLIDIGKPASLERADRESHNYLI